MRLIRYLDHVIRRSALMEPEYPTDAKGSAEMIGSSKVFKGTPALRNAPVAEGRFPVIVMAHGGFRAAPHHEGWIASYLAASGYIVGVTRPSALGLKDAEKAVKELWLRPADISAALSALENDPVLSLRTMPGSAAAVGFFLGSASSLALAGARLDPNNFGRSRDRPEAGVDCA